jgi:hypothetical protein
MLNRFDQPLKQRLTIQNIERMESEVKHHVESDGNNNTQNNSPKFNRKQSNMKT